MKIHKSVASLGIDEVVTARGRKAVSEFLALFLGVNPSYLDVSSKAGEIAESAGPEMMHAMVEVLILGKPEEQAIAAYSLWGVGHNDPDFLPKKVIDECEQVLARAFAAPTFNVCRYLANGPIPNVVATSLRKLIRHPDSKLALAASAAMINAELPDNAVADRLYATQVLVKELDSLDDMIAGIAGNGLLRLGVREEDSIAKLNTLFPKLNDETQFAILLTARDIGPKSKDLFNSAKSILKNKKKHPATRQAAAMALGRMSAGSTKAVAALVSALDDPDWVVVSGAVWGLNATGFLPDETISKLSGLLSHQDESMRRTAAKCLALVGPRAISVMPRLIQRLGDEPKLDICGELAQAVLNIGEPAVPPLIAIVVEGENSPKSEHAIRILAAMGEQVAGRIAEILRAADSDRVRNMVVIILTAMRERAAPAVPTLAHTLDEATNDELALYAAMAIERCGLLAIHAIPSLLNCIAQRGCTDPVAKIAQEAIWTMREHAVPELESAIKSASGPRRANLKQAMARLDASIESDLGRLLHYERDDLLAAFLDIGTVLKTQGPTSWPTMAKELKKKTLTPGYKGIAERIIAIRVGQLEKIHGVRLTTHGGHKTRKLTPEGLTLLQEIKEYFLKKSLLRRRHSKK